MEWARDYVREFFPDLSPEAAELFAAAIYRAMSKTLTGQGSSGV